MNLPLVSVIITNYNRALTISKAIESAIAQDYKNLEIIISDNCSTDNSMDIISKFKNDTRIKIFQNKNNLGMLKNFKLAFEERSKGAYLVNLSSDDFFITDTFITKAMQLVGSYDNIGLVFGKYVGYYESTKEIKKTVIDEYYKIPCKLGAEVFYDFLVHPHWGWAGCLIHKEKFIEVGGIPTTITGDLEVNLKIMIKSNVGFIDEDVYCFVYHNQNETGNHLNTSSFTENRLKMFLTIRNYFIETTHPKSLTKINHWYETLVYKDIKEYLSYYKLKGYDDDYLDLIAYTKKYHPHFLKYILWFDFRFLVLRMIIIPISKFKISKYILSRIFKDVKLFK